MSASSGGINLKPGEIIMKLIALGLLIIPISSVVMYILEHGYGTTTPEATAQQALELKKIEKALAPQKTAKAPAPSTRPTKTVVRVVTAKVIQPRVPVKLPCIVEVPPGKSKLVCLPDGGVHYEIPSPPNDFNPQKFSRTFYRESEAAPDERTADKRIGASTPRDYEPKWVLIENLNPSQVNVKIEPSKQCTNIR
ncbi:MAG: hypothetical protein PHS53_00960 [Candidatus Pacebacteria bacterium]|nr:hypothetical protein [Candidatus Paceibacterota bacterium]MDD5356707.1 hypothetical protein [Candidatus Paceibacterota bacterium]